MGKRDKKVVDEDMMHKSASTHYVNIFTSPELEDYDFRADLKEIPEAAEPSEDVTPTESTPS